MKKIFNKFRKNGAVKSSLSGKFRQNSQTRMQILFADKKNTTNSHG